MLQYLLRSGSHPNNQLIDDVSRMTHKSRDAIDSIFLGSIWTIHNIRFWDRTTNSGGNIHIGNILKHIYFISQNDGTL